MHLTAGHTKIAINKLFLKENIAHTFWFFSVNFFNVHGQIVSHETSVLLLIHTRNFMLALFRSISQLPIHAHTHTHKLINCSTSDTTQSFIFLMRKASWRIIPNHSTYAEKICILVVHFLLRLYFEVNHRLSIFLSV